MNKTNQTTECLGSTELLYSGLAHLQRLVAKHSPDSNAANRNTRAMLDELDRLLTGAIPAAPAPLAALERNVVEAAMAWRDHLRTLKPPIDVDQFSADLLREADALRAARAPKDPVAELREAWEAVTAEIPASQVKRMNAAIVAIAGRDEE